MAAERTRTSSQSSTELIQFVESAQKLVGSELPTLREVLRHGLYLQDSKHSSELVDKRNFPCSANARACVPEVLGIWKSDTAAFVFTCLLDTAASLRHVSWTLQYPHSSSALTPFPLTSTSGI